MDKRRQISELSQKAVDRRDERLMNLFEDDEEEVHEGIIFSELRNLAEDYTQKSDLARGGMKQISRVFDQRANRFVAIAELLKKQDSRLYEDFLREARLTALLDHPNIMNIHEIGLDEHNHPYFTMDLKQGDNLEVILKKREAGDALYLEKYGLNELLDIFQKVCNAIDYAHSKAVVHLDLKPDNIQVGDFGEVLLCDWGLSKILGQKNDLAVDNLLDPDVLNNMTLHGVIKGTPGYMAPEQITGEAKTQQTDIFALGCILYRICAGREAFRGEVEFLLKKTVKGIYTPVTELNKSLAHGLGAIVDKAMKAIPEERYFSVDQLLCDLRKYREGFATEAEKAGALRLLALLFKRHKTLCYFLVCFCVLSVSGLYVFVDRIAQERAIALEERDNAQLAKEKEGLARAEAEQNFLVAESAKKQSEKDAQLLIEEKKQLEKLNIEYVNDLVSQSVFISDNMNFWELHNDRLHRETLLYLDRAISLNSNAKMAWKQKAHLLFIMQRYRDAMTCFDHIKDVDKLKKICRESLGKERKSSINNFLKVLKDLGQLQPRTHYRSLMDQMVSYDHHANARTEEDKIAITRLLVEMWHPNKKIGFKFNAELRELELSGRINYLRFERNPSGKRRSILWLLEPKVLVFKDTEFKQLSQLFDLPLVKLDLRGTKAKDLKALAQFKTLERLIVEEGQFIKAELKALPQWIKWTQKELGEP
ncbi:protein kinase [Lentisphaera profundi]|uniref:Protein kinase n=1 Tax=Lentisphaera profundi TaxID=1658616 RepID=A0ABY7VT58_9BACT|nr:protein kinase [Lentisphaera profundi]WDE96494.1 protein kinase [Lentisphaera profundi]